MMRTIGLLTGLSGFILCAGIASAAELEVHAEAPYAKADTANYVLMPITVTKEGASVQGAQLEITTLGGSPAGQCGLEKKGPILAGNKDIYFFYLRPGKFLNCQPVWKHGKTLVRIRASLLQGTVPVDRGETLIGIEAR